MVQVPELLHKGWYVVVFEDERPRLPRKLKSSDICTCDDLWIFLVPVPWKMAFKFLHPCKIHELLYWGTGLLTLRNQRGTRV